MMVLMPTLWVALAMSVSAQAPAPAAKPATTPPASITLSGCVSRAPDVTGDFVFVDRTTGAEYRLTGRGIAKYAGQSVEVIGGTRSKRFSIRGGLRPTPNIAGQAGAIDPARAAVASRPGGGSTGTMGANPPEFRVTRMRQIEGVCR